MKTRHHSASSLDGFIATKDDALEWLFPLARHVVARAPDPQAAWPCAQRARVFTHRTLPEVVAERP